MEPTAPSPADQGLQFQPETDWYIEGGSPPDDAGPFSPSVIHGRTAETLAALFHQASVRFEIGEAVTGLVTLADRGLSFEAALRAVLAAADQPLRCSLEGGAYCVTVQADPRQWLPPYWVRAAQRMRALIEEAGPGRLYPQFLGFTCRVAASGHWSSDPEPSGSSGLASPMRRTFSDGTVVVLPFAPLESVRLEAGGEVTSFADETRSFVVVDSVPLVLGIPVLFDAPWERTEEGSERVVWQDVAGRSLTVYTRL